MDMKNEKYKNLDKRQKECLDLIESLGIYELRALARIFGDNSPTTLKRSDHIRIIMDKIISGEELRPIPLRQGRPYKQLSNIDGILEKLSEVSGKEYQAKSSHERIVSTQKVISFHQAKDDILKQRLMPIDVCGVLCERNSKEFYFRDLNNDVLVLIPKTFDFRLQKNDFVTGRAILMNDEGDYAIEVLKSINFCSDKLYANTSHPYEQTSPFEKFHFCGQNILLGGRYVFKATKLVDAEEKINEALKGFKEKGIVTMAIVPNVLSEDEERLKSFGFDALFAIKYQENTKEAYEKICSLSNCISRLQEQGQSLAIFVEDAVTLANISDFAFKNNEKALMGHTENTVDTFKRFMLLAKADKAGSHTTLFVTKDEADLADQMYVSCIFKLSKSL